MNKICLSLLIWMLFFATNCKKDPAPLTQCSPEIGADNNLIQQQRILGKDGDQFEIRSLIASGDGGLYYQGLFNEKQSGDYYTVIVGQNGSPDTIPAGLGNKKIYQFGKMDADFNIIWAVSTNRSIQKIMALGSNAGALSNGILVLIDDHVMLYDRNGNKLTEKDLEILNSVEFDYTRNILWLSENSEEISYMFTGSGLDQMLPGFSTTFPCLIKFTVSKIDNSIQVVFKKFETTRPDYSYPYSAIDLFNSGRFIAGNGYNNSYFSAYDFDGNFLEYIPHFDIRRSTFLEKARIIVTNIPGTTTISYLSSTSIVTRNLASVDYSDYNQTSSKILVLGLDESERSIHLKPGVLSVFDAYYNTAIEFNDKLYAIGQIRKRSNDSTICEFDHSGIEVFDIPSSNYLRRYNFAPAEITDKTSQFTQATLMGNYLFLVGTLNQPGQSANQQVWLTKIPVSAL